MEDPRIKTFEEILKLWKRRKDLGRPDTFARIGAILYLYEQPLQEKLEDGQTPKAIQS